MEKFECKECNKVYDNVKSLSMHRSRQHSVESKLTYDEYILNGIIPTCKCGCGENVNFLSTDKGYVDYVRGHSQRVNNNWGHNPEALKKSHSTQKKMYESGELEIWNKGLTMDDPRVKKNIDKMLANPDRGDNISKGLTGIKRSDEYKEKMSISQKESWDNEEKRNKQRDNRMKYMVESGMIPTSKLEDKFEEILNSVFNLELNVDYYRQFYVREIKSLYDFKISGKKILIEIDGDYWHCNPNTKFKTPIYEAQKNNLKKDKIKNKWCEENDYTLIRLWEYDIHNNLNEVINRLKEII